MNVVGRETGALIVPDFVIFLKNIDETSIFQRKTIL